MATVKWCSFILHTQFLIVCAVCIQNEFYRINLKTKECEKFPLTSPFQPIEVPPEAHFRGSEYVGVEGLIGAGFETELWVGSTERGTWFAQ